MNKPTEAQVSYVCPKHREYYIESKEPGFCNKCGREKIELKIGVICDCGAEYLFKTNYCENCGRKLEAENWANYKLGNVAFAMSSPDPF